MIVSGSPPVTSIALILPVRVDTTVPGPIRLRDHGSDATTSDGALSVPDGEVTTNPLTAAAPLMVLRRPLVLVKLWNDINWRARQTSVWSALSRRTTTPRTLTTILRWASTRMNP